jgi:methionyl-tRNA formyltransferase
MDLMTGRMSWLQPVWEVWPFRATLCGCTDDRDCRWNDKAYAYSDLLVTVGWRHMIPRRVLARPLGVVGFHSAKLPEYPGRAPVANAILRGDEFTENTMLFLTEEPDAGDIIDSRVIPVTTPGEMNRRMGETAAEMLRQHLPALLDGTAPRTPQDPSKRGPLTPADAWKRLDARQPAWVEAFG